MLPLFLLLVAVKGIQSDSLVVETSRGSIRGLPADDGEYNMFLGIPFGQVDKGNPFGAAQPYPVFTEVFNANNDSAICPQVEELSNDIMGTLDCLNLNVYVPKIAATPKVPVLVWIHGGGFFNGYGGKVLYGPRFLVRHGIIVVTVNYRLGPYGFMCLDIPEVPGNQGLKDQTLALRWIRDNIGAFGGDVNKVTLYGESAGAASVEFHLASENEKLFQQAILSSGAIFGDWTTMEVDNSAPINIASKLGFETDNIQEALTFLKDADPLRLIEVVRTVPNRFTGCIEKKFDSVKGFLHVHPNTLQTLPKAVGMPIITGYNNQEMLMSFANVPPEMFPNMDPFINYARRFPEEQVDEVYNFLRRFYIGDDDITENVKWELIDFSSDNAFNYASYRSLIRFLDTEAKVYHYIFSYAGKRNMLKVRLNITEGGAAHADELGYVFDMKTVLGLGDEADFTIVDRITMLWANFVKYGNPTPQTTQLLPVVWPAATKEKMNYIDIGSELVAGTRPFHERMTFWDLFNEVFPRRTNAGGNSGVVNRLNSILLLAAYCFWKVIS